MDSSQIIKFNKNMKKINNLFKSEDKKASEKSYKTFAEEMRATHITFSRIIIEKMKRDMISETKRGILSHRFTYLFMNNDSYFHGIEELRSMLKEIIDYFEGQGITVVNDELFNKEGNSETFDMEESSITLTY